MARHGRSFPQHGIIIAGRRGFVFAATISATSSGAVSVIKSVGKVVAVACSAAMAMLKSVASMRLVTATSSTVVVRSVGKIVSAASSTAASVAAGLFHVCTIAATVTCVVVTSWFGWLSKVIQSESWTEKSKDAETWTEKTKQAETWTDE